MHEIVETLMQLVLKGDQLPSGLALPLQLVEVAGLVPQGVDEVPLDPFNSCNAL